MTRKEKISMAAPAIMREGTMKLRPQVGAGSLAVRLAQKEGMTVPRMFPTDV